MGHAAAHFHDANDAARQTLHRRVTPSDTQFEDQQARWNALAGFLLPRLRDESDYTTRSWLQGSYKYATQVRPVHKDGEFDIDLGIYFCWEGDPDDGDHSPQALKQMVQKALADFAAENEDVIEVVRPPKVRCCRIRFKGGFHIDVPCYHLDEKRDARSLATEDDTWEDSDPKALYNWFKAQFDEDLRARVRRLIRYVKAWAALKFHSEHDRPSSVLLTVMVSRAVLGYAGELPESDDEALDVVLRDMHETALDGQNVRNPVNATENLAGRLGGEAWDAFVTALGRFSEIAAQAIAAQDEVVACTLWSEPFEHLFPLPDMEAILKEDRYYPALRTLPEIRVTAVARNNPNLRFSGINQIGPIPKGCNITFNIINAPQMPLGTQYYWMVRNEGDEAEDINDLGHKSGQGTAASEESAYNGMHYMDCTAVAGGRIVGVRRVRVQINSMAAPRRNPPKPGWVSLRGRR